MYQPFDKLRANGELLIIVESAVKKRLDKDRPMKSITLRIPVDVVDSMKAIAPQKEFSGYQTLLKLY